MAGDHSKGEAVDYNAYHRSYARRRYARRRKQAVEFLGSTCRCGSTLRLEIYIPKTLRAVASSNYHSVSEAVFWAEMKKATLLCRRCHVERRLLDAGKPAARGQHGTISSYRWCGPPKCAACKAAKLKIHKNWKWRRAVT